MTPKQAEAEKVLGAMKYRLEKSVKFLRAEHETLLRKDPEQAAAYMAEKEPWRVQRRNELLALFSSHQEAKEMADAINACYATFLLHCPAADPFNLTDQDLEELTLENLITCLTAINWLKLFSLLNIPITKAMAVYLATTYQESPWSATLNLAWGNAMEIDAAANAIGVTP